MKRTKGSMVAGVMAAVTAAVITFSAAPGQAGTIELRLINGVGDTGWITAGGNSVTFNGAVGDYTINVSTAISSNSMNPILDLNSVNLTNTGSTSPLIIEAMASDYTLSAGTFQLQVGGTSSIDSASFAAFGGNNNTICPAGINACTPVSNGSTLIGTLGPFTSSPFVGSVFGSGNSVSPYSVGIVATFGPVTHGGVGSFDASLSVPEPGSLLLLGFALAGLGFWQLKRQKNTYA